MRFTINSTALVLLMLAVFPMYSQAMEIGQLSLSAGPVLTYEGNSSGNGTDLQTPLALRAGWDEEYGQVQLEYSGFRTPSGGQYIEVERRRNDFRVGVRKSAGLGFFLEPSLGLQVGWIWENVTTRLGQQSVESQGKGEPLISVSGSLSRQVSNHFFFDIEARLSSSRSLMRPAPLASIGFFAGYHF